MNDSAAQHLAPKGYSPILSTLRCYSSCRRLANLAKHRKLSVNVFLNQIQTQLIVNTFGILAYLHSLSFMVAARCRCRQ